MNESANLAIPRRPIDTNVIIRYLVGDGADHAIKAKKIFQDASDQKVILIIPEIVFIEVVFVLNRHYKIAKTEITNALRQLISLPGIQTKTPLSVLKRALDFFENILVPWPDALIAAHALEDGTTEIISFDGHFDKFDGLSKITP